MIELTKQQHEALKAGETRVHDSVTDETYILLREEVYDRPRPLMADDAAAAANKVMADDDATDPLLDSNQHFAKDRL